MKKEKLLLAIVSLAMITCSILGIYMLMNDEQTKVFSKSVASKQPKERKAGITQMPFQVLVSGADESGKTEQDGRSDINLLLTVNPVSKVILITEISRDTYINFSDYDNISFQGLKNDEELNKLETARLCEMSCYGISPLVKTVEGILDTKIDYYIKLNFKGFIALIDAIGGVDVEAHEDFQTDWHTFYKKGINHLNGAKALAFVRERRHLNRAEKVSQNRIEMMKAIVNQLLGKSILEMDSEALYQLFKNNIYTNMSAGEILSLVRMQVSDRADWDVKSVMLKGNGSLKKVSAYNHEVHVSVAKKSSIKEIQKQIKDVCKLEKSPDL